MSNEQKKRSWRIELHDGKANTAWMKHGLFISLEHARQAFEQDKDRLTQTGGYIRLLGPKGHVIDMHGGPTTYQARYVKTKAT
jgi:hypothetical protein